MTPTVNSYYRHYKGGLYHVDAIVTHTETKDELVIYHDTEGNEWARPIEMWNEQVDGKPRFGYLHDQIEAFLLFQRMATTFTIEK